MQDTAPILYGPNGQPIRSMPATVKSTSIPNLDRDFFWTSPRGNTVTASDIEDKPYQYHHLVYILASICANNISGQLKKRLRDRETKEYLDTDAMGINAVLRAPNTFMTATTLFEATVLYLLLPSRAQRGISGNGDGKTGGQCFWICTKANGEKVNLYRGEVPEQIFPYNDEFVCAYTVNGRFAGWKFEIPGIPESKEIYLPGEIIRFYRFNPYSILRGLSPYIPSLLTINQDISSELWNSRLFDNDAVPQGLLSTEEDLDPSDRRELLRSWYEQYGGPSNARRVALLSGGLKFQALSIAPKDMEWTNQKSRTDEIITGAFGLNKIARGNIESINRATIEYGRRIIWEDTYLPLDNKITETINHSWMRYVPPGRYELVSDTSNVSVLQPNHAAKTKPLVDMTQTGVPVTVAARILDIPITQDDVKAYPWLAEYPPNATAPATEPVEEHADDDADDKDPPKKSIAPRLRTYNREEIRRISDTYVERVLTPGEKSALGVFEKFFTTLANALQDKVDEWLKQTTANKATVGAGDSTYHVDIDSFLVNSEDMLRELEKVYKPVVVDQMRRAASKLKEEIPALVNWNVTPEMIELYAGRRRQVLREINNLTFEKVREQVADVITEAVDNNWTPQETAKAVKEAIKVVRETRKNQSTTIARTEIGSISADVRADAYDSIGIEYIQWVNANDENVRADHDHLPVGDGGMVIRYGDVFPKTGLHYPLDPAGEPGQIINCRCTMVAVPELPDQQGPQE